MSRIVVVGGGYAGVLAANRLAGRAGTEVVLVEPQERFVERIRLHELVAGSRPDATVSYDGLLHPSIRRLQQVVAAVRPDADEVELADGTVLPYDRLILATGSGPGAVEPGSHSIAGLRPATAFGAALRQALAAAAGTPVAVRIVGGGLTGIEAATELAEHLGGRVSVTLVSRTLAPGLSDRGRRAVAKVLRRLDVTTVTVENDAPAADLRLDCTGFVAVAPFADTLPVDDRGAYRLRPTLQLAGHDRIFVAGDAGAVDDPAYAHVRMSCAAGLSLAAAVADVVAADLDGRPLQPVSIGFVGQCLSLGRRAGVIQFVGADDRPRDLVLSGRLGAVVKEQVCRQTQRWLRKEARKPGSYRITKGPRASVSA